MRLKNPSADRNCQPILERLFLIMDRNTEALRLLEVASGTGQHVAHFAKHFPNVKFYPSESDPTMLSSIAAHCNDGLTNVCRPMVVDIRTPYGQWDWITVNERPHNVAGKFDYVLNINMIHITPWACSEGLFKNASGLLKTNGLIITYGPYAVNGTLIPESNVAFDQQLRTSNPNWGVRDIRDLSKLADTYGIVLKEIYNMPANNKLCVWRKTAHSEFFKV